MSSIYGAIGPSIAPGTVRLLREAALDRGTEAPKQEFYSNGISHALLGHVRSAPTDEPEVVENQPYEQLVHDGRVEMINVCAAGEGEINSQALARYLNNNARQSATRMAAHLGSVKGAYSIACWNGETVYLACSYRPLYYADIGNTYFFSSMERHFENLLPQGVAPVRLEPYTVLDILGHQQVPIQRPGYEKRAVVLASAGIDSTVAARKLQREGWNILLLHIKYGCQAEAPELLRLRDIAERLGMRLKVIPLPLRNMVQGSLLSGNIRNAEANPGNISSEWLPARNFMFTALAVAYAEANGYHAVALGNNIEAAGAYPDNEEEFTHLLNKAMPYAVAPNYKMEILSPVGRYSKTQIIKEGLDIGAPLELTWSCYYGDYAPCGKCSSCIARHIAYQRCGAVDPAYAASKLQNEADRD